MQQRVALECPGPVFSATSRDRVIPSITSAAPNHRQTESCSCAVSLKAWIVSLCLFSLLGFTGRAAAASPQSGGGRPPMVTVEAVTEQEVNPPSDYVGRVEAIQAVDLRARVEGFIEHVKFQEGGKVKAGDLLYLIEQAPYKAKVNEAAAKVADAEASLTEARQYLKRLQSVRSGGVSATDLEAAVSTELKAKALLQQAQASLEQSELDLGYTVIKAPISGRIGRTTYTKGNLVGPASEALARIVQLDPIRVVYSMSENDLVSDKLAREGGCAEDPENRLVPRIQMPDGQMYPAAGRLDFVDNQVDASTGTIAVRAVFDNREGILLPGQYVNVLIRCSEGKRLPVVPQSAVQEDREGRYVFTVDAENRVQQRRIKTGAAIGTNWAVESGLMTGETIIVQGVQKVSPGQIVETVTTSGQSKE
ncbi:MAG: efflux RND transporter periplasmic adaptor subunit [Desulfobacterales bacterium]|nr:efflux RND transporter periplasmic adaptor subunit [Desulfobacterales bacterium]